MIACCVGDRVLLPKIFSPAERAGAYVRGINGAMLHQFIDDALAQAVEGLDRYPVTLVLDRAAIHTNIDAIRQQLRKQLYTRIFVPSNLKSSVTRNCKPIQLLL
jgi:hypothetical protein